MTERTVVDFDHHTEIYQENVHEIYRDLRDRCPVGWSEKHGGYWIVSGYDEISEALRNHATFSSAKWQDAEGVWLGGDVIPDNPAPPLLPLDVDPPEWNGYRRLLNPWLSPGRVDERRSMITAYATEFLDRVIEKGRVDLVTDFANPLPALITLNLIGLEVDDWQKWSEPFHAIQYCPPGSPGFDKALSDMGWQRQQLASAIQDRLTRPRDDMVTAVANGEVEGRRITPDEGAGLIITVVGGGVDTTTATVVNGLKYLSDHPAARNWLLDDLEARIPSACEEFLRWYPPVLSVARTVTGSVELGGQHLRPGDRVALAVVSANHDLGYFEAPDEVRLDRPHNRHATFGMGIHRCVGSHAARAMLYTMVEQVLRRIPDYNVISEESVRYGPSTVVDGWINMPAIFTPGAKVGSGLDLR